MLSPVLMLDSSLLVQARRVLSTSAPLAAARKGTRERKKAKVVKKEDVKTEWMPENVRRAQLLSMQPRANRRFDSASRPEPVDDVYVRNWFRWPQYRLEEAIAMHRETHHPTVFNQPESLVFVTAEFDMQMDKKLRFADSVRRVVALPHAFEFVAPREVAVFCQSAALRQAVEQLGVAVVGGSELIKQFQSGALAADEFDYFIGHPELAQEMLPLRGLLKRRFPSINNGTLTTELEATVQRFRHGLEVVSERDEYQPDFAQAVTPIGRLHMATEHLADNLAALLTDLEAARPRGHSRPFITRLSSWCQPATEKFDIDFRPLLEKGQTKTEARAGVRV